MEALKQKGDEIQPIKDNQSVQSASTSSWQDAFFGLADSYIENVLGSESSSENLENANQAHGNTDVIYQPPKGTTSAGETIVVDENPINYKKIGVYSAIGFGLVLLAGVTYKVVK